VRCVGQKICQGSWNTFSHFRDWKETKLSTDCGPRSSISVAIIAKCVFHMSLGAPVHFSLFAFDYFYFFYFSFLYNSHIYSSLRGCLFINVTTYISLFRFSVEWLGSIALLKNCSGVLPLLEKNHFTALKLYSSYFVILYHLELVKTFAGRHSHW
jgi:hypothetical protein